MTATLYICGYLSKDKTQVLCPLESSVVLFIAKYCQSNTKLILVSASEDDIPSSYICVYDLDNLSDFCIEFSSWQDLPSLMKNVALPSVHQPELKLVRSGLCVVLRHIIGEAHSHNPSLNLIDLLGFRQGSMKMCAEVSSWTKLCEVDIPSSVAQLIMDIEELKYEGQRNSVRKQLTLPAELMTLENHFNQKCLIHNDNKGYRAEIMRLKELFTKYLEEPATESHSVITSEEVIERLNSSHMSKEQLLCLDTLSFNDSEIIIEQTIQLNHGVRKLRVCKNVTNNSEVTSENEKLCKDDNVTSTGDDGMKKKSSAFNLSDLKAAVMELSYKDIEFERLYSEGIELTVADLILIAYIYNLLNTMNFAAVQNLSSHLQHILKWTEHMLSLAQVRRSAERLGWNLTKLNDDVCHRLSQLEMNSDEPSNIPGDHDDNLIITFQRLEKDDEEEVELSRCAKMKHKALKPEVIEALKKLETVGIRPITGPHPKGEEVQVDWDSMPDGVHPKQGSVPVKRTQRKCQQLENLATAVQSVAQSGDVIVDFCSGGGHLGILCAYLLPECQVYLVENKEESLLKSSSRLQSLGLNNVTLYQCNMDYFIGLFNVGLCLHACGSATDMVLELCTKSQASFVICPCCYGSIRNTHLLEYPRSQRYLQANILYTDFLTMGHAADQTEFDIKLEKQGRACMNLVDTDRAEYAREQGYDVTLCSLKPFTCSPKNNLLIGTLRKNGSV